MKRMMMALLVIFSIVMGCSDAKVASRNLAVAAENFEINRRIIFLNGITDTYLLSIVGKCSLDHQRGQLEVTCKTGKDTFIKHHLGLSDNVSYFSEQIGDSKIDVNYYRVIFKPSVIIPNIDYK